MTDVGDNNLDDRIESRLNTLCRVLSGTSVRGLNMGPIVFLCRLVSHAQLRDLQFDRVTEPTFPTPVVVGGRVPSMEIDVTQNKRVYRISRRTREAMIRVVENRALDEQARDWMIDNYFIHELLHFAQGMGGGNHSGLGAQAPQVLLALDYQADAIAAVTATVLAWCHPEEFGFASVEQENHWTLYVRAIEAILNQMEIFTLLSRRDMDRAQISTMRNSLERLQRIATWHYQVHRARRFLADRPLADFQILAQPILDFRNVSWASAFAPNALRRDWPTQERVHFDRGLSNTSKQKGQMVAPEGRSQLIVTGVTQYGTTYFRRHSAATELQYQQAFEGFFDNNDRASRDFFTTLFEQNRLLAGQGDPSSVTTGWGATECTSKLSKLTRGLALNDPAGDRLDLLDAIMAPSPFSQVRMLG